MLLDLYMNYYNFVASFISMLSGKEYVSAVTDFDKLTFYNHALVLLYPLLVLALLYLISLDFIVPVLSYIFKSLIRRLKERAPLPDDHTSNAEQGTLVVTKMGDHIFSARTSDEVLAAHKDLISKLKAHIDFTGDSFEMVALPMIERLASLCGSLPASEFNHDHGEYGLFRHSLEVAIESLEPNSRDFCFYKAWRSEKSGKAYLRFKNPCSGLALMFAAFSHDLSKLYTDYQVIADNGMLYDPRCMDMNDFIEHTKTKSLRVVFNKSRAHRHELGIASRSALLLTDFPLAYFLTTGFTYPPTDEEYATRIKYELYEQNKDGEVTAETAASSASEDSSSDKELIEGEISSLKKKRSRTLTQDEQQRLAHLQELKQKQEEIRHFDTPNHWSNADVAALLDGSHPLWAIVAKADSFCSFCSNVTRNDSVSLPSYLVTYMIHLLKDQAHVVNNFYADIFLMPKGVFLRKGSIQLKALSHRIKAIKEDNRQDWLTTLRSINAIHMASNMRSYSWGQLECEGEVFYELGLIVKVNLPQKLVEAFPRINFIERGFNPPELVHIDWDRLQITRCDRNEKGQVAPTAWYSDEIRAPAFFKRYHSTVAEYVKNLRIDESSLKDVLTGCAKRLSADPADDCSEGELSGENHSSDASDEAQSDVLHKISSGSELLDGEVNSSAIAEYSDLEKSVAEDLEIIKAKKKASSKKTAAGAGGSSTSSASKAKKTAAKKTSTKSKVPKSLKKSTHQVSAEDEKTSVVTAGSEAASADYEDLRRSLYQTLQLMCTHGQCAGKTSPTLQMDGEQKQRLDAMLPMFMSLLANASPEALSQSLKQNFGIVADREQLAQHAQLLLSDVIEHGQESAGLADKSSLKNVSAQP